MYFNIPSVKMEINHEVLNSLQVKRNSQDNNVHIVTWKSEDTAIARQWQVRLLARSSSNLLAWVSSSGWELVSQSLMSWRERNWVSESQQSHSPVEGEWPLIDPSSCQRGGTISKHVKVWKEHKYGQGAQNHEWLCWWGSAAAYWIGLSE
jgi:hypothetical protein